MNDMLRRLHERRDSAVAARRRIVEMAKRERRDADRLTESEDREFRSLSEQVKEYDERIAELENAEARTAGAQRASAAWTGGGWRSESRVYTPDGPHSYVRDLVSTVRQTADMDARQRLATYEQEQRDLNRADGSGGTFVPPAWAVGDFVGLPRPGRVMADLLTRRPLPPGTNTINIPKIATGTATAVQPADNDPVQEVDLTDTTIVAPVRTTAGQQDVAVQLLDRSPVNFDEIILRDLLADYATKLNAQVLSGSGLSGQLQGLRTLSGVES